MKSNRKVFLTTLAAVIFPGALWAGQADWEEMAQKVSRGQKISVSEVFKEFGTPDLIWDRVSDSDYPGIHKMLFYSFDPVKHGKNHVLSLLIVDGYVKNFGLGRFPAEKDYSADTNLPPSNSEYCQFSLNHHRENSHHRNSGNIGSC